MLADLAVARACVRLDIEHARYVRLDERLIGKAFRQRLTHAVFEGQRRPRERLAKKLSLARIGRMRLVLAHAGILPWSRPRLSHASRIFPDETVNPLTSAS